MASRRDFMLAGTLGAAGAAGAAVLGPAATAGARTTTTPAGTVFHDAYAGKCGLLHRSDSGHPYVYTGGLDLVARDGALQLSTASLSRPVPGAAYQQADLGAPITYMGVWFRLDASAGTTNGSGVLLGGFATRLLDATTLSAGLHLGFGLDYWVYYLFDRGTPVVVAHGPYAPLATNTLHYVEVTIAGDTATVITPDGVSHTATDPRIATLGRSWLTTEVVRSATTDALGVYTAVQAATG